MGLTVDWRLLMARKKGGELWMRRGESDLLVLARSSHIQFTPTHAYTHAYTHTHTLFTHKQIHPPLVGGTGSPFDKNPGPPQLYELQVYAVPQKRLLHRSQQLV